jgi:DNA-binding protein H-NS
MYRRNPFKETPMAIAALKKMDVFELIDLREQVDARIREVRRDLEQSLSKLDGKAKRGSPAGNGRGHGLKGKKVAPKYRSKEDPKLTWTGRGLAPKWIKAEMKAGKLQKDDFLIQ